jgi:hypothetical protein
MKHTINLTTEELLVIANDTESNLQNAIDNRIPRRILFYTNMRNKIHSTLSGPVAQRLEQSTHNALVAGSNPAGSTIVVPK